MKEVLAMILLDSRFKILLVTHIHSYANQPVVSICAPRKPKVTVSPNIYHPGVYIYLGGKYIVTYLNVSFNMKFHLIIIAPE